MITRFHSFCATVYPRYAGNIAAHLMVVAFVWILPRDTGADQAQSLPDAVRQAEDRRIETIARAIAPTIAVFAPDGVGGGGSGVIISADGYALTNFHVTAPCGEYVQCGLSDGQLYDAILVGIDPTGDVALIKLLGRNDFPHAPLGDSDRVQQGDPCFAVGNPFLLATDLQPTVTCGIISGVHRYQAPSGTLLEYADCLQTDAAINPGNSGGPLFNMAGEVIGINGRCSFEKRGRVSVGVGYAISVNQIKRFLGYLKSGRVVDHATLGATVATDEQGHVTVTNILSSSDAFRRGLRYGDQIVRFGDRAIETANQFKNVLGTYPRGWRIPLSFVRNGDRHDILVRLAGVHGEEELLEKVRRNAAEPEIPEPRDSDEKKGAERPEPAAEPSAKRPELPPSVAAQYSAKRGYANFHFNQLELRRVWDSFRQHVPLSRGDRPWRAAGVWQGQWQTEGARRGQGPAEIIWLPGGLRAELPSGRFRLDPQQPLDQQLMPADTGGLLLALHVWQRLATHEPATFGQLYYLGTSPWLDGPAPGGAAGESALADVLVGTYDTLETYFYFQHERLVGLEMYPASEVDPCELHFSDYRATPIGAMPYRIEIRHADFPPQVLEIQTWDDEDRG